MSNRGDEARRLVQQGHYDSAIAAYEALLVEEPEDTTMLFGLLAVLLKLNRYPEAISTCERLAESWRSKRFYSHAVIFYVHAYGYLLKHAAHLKDRFNHVPVRLSETFQEIRAKDGPFIQDSLATRGGREGNEHALIELLRRVIEVDPDNPLPHQCLIDALVRVGDKKEANKQSEILAKLVAKQQRQR